MTSKINGYENRPVQLGTDKAVTRKDASVADSSTSTPLAAQGGVRITDQARQLAALEQVAQSLPEIDEARVEQVRDSILQGTYTVDAERVADGLLSIERDLRR